MTKILAKANRDIGHAIVPMGAQRRKIGMADRGSGRLFEWWKGTAIFRRFVFLGGSLAAGCLGLAIDLAAQQREVGANPPGGELLTGIGVPMTGDLISVGGTVVRLEGIAAPLQGQLCKNRYGREYDCFAIATAVLEALVADRTVNCRVTATDRNRNAVGVCSIAGVDLGAAMVARGWAFVYNPLTHRYGRSQSFAQARRIGMWAGRVEKPWQYRSRHLREQGP